MTPVKKEMSPAEFTKAFQSESANAVIRIRDAGNVYYSADTPQSVIDAAIKVLGPAFVKPIP